MTFGKSIDHVAEVNNFACSKISGVAAPEGAKINETDKEQADRGTQSLHGRLQAKRSQN